MKGKKCPEIKFDDFAPRHGNCMASTYSSSVFFYERKSGMLC